MCFNGTGKDRLLPNNYLCLSYKCNKRKYLLLRPITPYKYHWFCHLSPEIWQISLLLPKNWLLVFTTPHIAKQGLFLKSSVCTLPKIQLKHMQYLDLTEINRVYGCQGSKTTKMGVHFSTSFFLMLYKACSPFCSFFPWGELWFPWCTTPVIFNTNTVNWFTCLEKPL